MADQPAPEAMPPVEQTPEPSAQPATPAPQAAQAPKTPDALDDAVASAALATAKGEKAKSSVDLSGLKGTILNYIVPLIALGLSVLIGLFVLWPSYNSLPDLQVQLQMQQKLEMDLRNKLDNLNRLVDFKGIVDENSDLVNRVLVSDQLVPGLLTQIDKIGQESGMTVTRLNYGLGTTNAVQLEGNSFSYDFVAVNLGANGTFGQLQTFLRSLENAARVINVDKIRYSLSATEEGDLLGVNFVLISPYLYVEENAITDDPIDLDISSPEFIGLINKLKGMRYYNPNDINASVPVNEVSEEEIEGEGFEEQTPPEGSVDLDEVIEETLSNEEPLPDDLEF